MLSASSQAPVHQSMDRTLAMMPLRHFISTSTLFRWQVVSSFVHTFPLISMEFHGHARCQSLWPRSHPTAFKICSAVGFTLAAHPCPIRRVESDSGLRAIDLLALCSAVAVYSLHRLS